MLWRACKKINKHLDRMIDFLVRKARINGAFVEIMLKSIREISWMKNNRFLSYSFVREERNE